MAERIISPGVFTRENDQSFIAQGVNNIGATIIGPTQKGPAFIPTVVNSVGNFETRFGNDSSSTYVPLTVRNYLSNASSVTIVRVLGNGGWLFTPTRQLAAIGISGSNVLVSVFHPSKNTSPDSLGLQSSSLTPSTVSMTGSMVIMFSGSGMTSQSYSSSLVRTGQQYLLQTIGTNENNSLTGSLYKATAYPYINFRDYQYNSSASIVQMVKSDGDIIFTSSYAEGYSAASTPWATDGNSNNPQNLFKFVSISHGTATNTDAYVSITGLQEPADINGIQQYSTFAVLVRQVGDSDTNPTILEQYNNVNLDPTSPNFIARVIGDKYFEYNTTLKKVTSVGNYANNSGFVRVQMSDAFTADLTVSSLSPKSSPRGFTKYYQTICGFTNWNLVPVSYKTDQNINNSYSDKTFLGFDLTVQDNYNYLKPIPSNASGISVAASQSNFTVQTLFGHPSASWIGSLSASIDLAGITGPLPSQVQFTLAMQGGSDGMNPATIRNMGSNIAASNVFGFNLSTGGSAGSVAFTKAINILSNQDAYDMNLLVIPGVLYQYHSAVVQNAINMVTDRGDTFYIMDSTEENSTVSNAVNTVVGLDANYAGTYYPWVRVIDPDLNRPMFVPPSVVIPGVFSFNDANGAEWTAPAGLQRGLTSTVIDVKNYLSKPETDVLYDGRVNPIISFPGQGIVVWGQKTLQLRHSALDRINVRRLLIALKKFIASSSRYLVFEGNTTVTRNKFLSIVNPYLESVIQKQGLYAARVVMDDSNNTSDVIDRNQLVGAIYLQPTRTAEYIILDFNIMPTGATFGQ